MSYIGSVNMHNILQIIVKKSKKCRADSEYQIVEITVTNHNGDHHELTFYGKDIDLQCLPESEK